jgi:glutamyl-tRNA synthetase
MIRTRFAPSPTGYLHIGGVRTALFCWLFARNRGGQFILRIDDTDRQRNVEEALAPILAGLRWLGIDWDEGPEVGGPFGPYFQSERAEIHRHAAEELLARGFAYRDYATPEEIQQEREAAQKEKRPFVYSRRWMAETPEDQARFEAEGRAAVVRLKMPREGVLVIDDLVRGPVEFQWAQEQDHVIQRSDGSCLYHLASAIDDHEMEITHVIRAEEHLSNTPRQVFILQSLGYELPQFAHLPFVAEPGSKTKLSKRKLDKYLKNRDFAELVEHGRSIADRLSLTTDPDTFNPVIVDFYRQVGYLPEALLNYLALLGWSLDDKTEHFTREELVKCFTLDRVIKSPASFDPAKLRAFQMHHMMALPVERKVALVLPYLQCARLVPEPAPPEFRRKTAEILRAAEDRVKVAGDILDYDYFFVPDSELQYDAQAIDKRLRKPGASELLRQYKEEIADLRSFSAGGLRSAFLKVVRPTLLSLQREGVTTSPHQLDALQRDLAIAEAVSFDATTLEERHMGDFLAARALKMGEIIHAIRVAITGKAVGPSLFDCMSIIGRDACVARMERALNVVKPDPNAFIDQLQRFPAAQKAAIDIDHLEQSLSLYAGPITLAGDDWSCEGKGSVRLVWIPRPAVRFEMTAAGISPDRFFGTSGEARLTILDKRASVDALVTGFSFDFGGESVLSGIPNGRFDVGDGSELDSVIFHLTNFHEFRGSPIREGSSVRAGRVVFSAEGWVVTIDAVGNVKNKTRDALKRGTNAITHIGSLTREDRSTFTSVDSDSILEPFRYFLSFARGFWVAPMFAVGFDPADRRVWEDWTLPQFDEWQGVFSWCPVHNMEDVFPLFGSFAERWREPEWKKLLKGVLYWYVLSNRGGSIDRSVVTAQIILEWISGFLLENRTGDPNSTESEAERVALIEELLARAQIPSEIPEELGSLRALADEFGVGNGPRVLRALRNSYVHPGRASQRLADASHRTENAVFEAWRLSLWYADLVILWLLGYTGRYSSRLQLGFAGHSKRVPWQEPFSPTSAAAKIAAKGARDEGNVPPRDQEQRPKRT